jgi:hypothetical protein
MLDNKKKSRAVLDSKNKFVGCPTLKEWLGKGENDPELIRYLATEEIDPLMVSHAQQRKLTSIQQLHNKNHLLERENDSHESNIDLASYSTTLEGGSWISPLPTHSMVEIS